MVPLDSPITGFGVGVFFLWEPDPLPFLPLSLSLSSLHIKDSLLSVALQLFSPPVYVSTPHTCTMSPSNCTYYSLNLQVDFLGVQNDLMLSQPCLRVKASPGSPYNSALLTPSNPQCIFTCTSFIFFLFSNSSFFKKLTSYIYCKHVNFLLCLNLGSFSRFS